MASSDAMPHARVAAPQTPNRTLIAIRASDVLKVGHHGSAYSSAPSFIAAVRPRSAIISAGRHNLFGHPAATTLGTLRRIGATVYRTDLCGAISVEPRLNVHTTMILQC